MIFDKMCCFLTVFSLALLFIEQVNSVCDVTQKEKWSYEGDNGPDKWKNNYPACGGDMQSPIKMAFPDYTASDKLDKLEFKNYDKAITKAELKNNGHTVVVTPKDGTERTIKGNGTEYKLDQFNFHWGLSSNDGTEHAIFGRKYSIEIHFVHKNGDKIAVFAVQFQQHKDASSLWFKPIAEEMKNVKYKGQTSELKKEIDLSVVTNAPKSYLAYMGSLTTPPCTEGVQWFVSMAAEYMAESQLNMLRDLQANEKKDKAKDGDCKQSLNIRPEQKGRKYYHPE